MIQLLYRTDNVQVDNLLIDVVDRYESAYPNQIRSYYLHGSYVNKTAIETSDVDLTIVFKAAEQQSALDFTSTALELDIAITSEDILLASSDPLIKLASALIYGEDIRDQLPMPSILAWTRDRMHTSYWRIVNLFHRPARIVYPINYPDPSDEFYGYLQRKGHNSEVPNTRDLIRHTGWAATALVAFRTGQFVLHKSDCHHLYRQYIGDDWSRFLQNIYQSCKLEWHYQIPQRQTERNRLRDLCQQTLAFENHFLREYKEFLLQELHSADPKVRQHAQWLQGKIPFLDPQISEALSSSLRSTSIQADDA